MLTLVFALTGLVLAASGFLFGATVGNSVGLVATLVSGASIIRQYRELRPFVYLIDKSTWNEKNCKSYTVSISPSKHKKGPNPHVVTFWKNKQDFEEVICDKKINSSGVVHISASQPFVGKVELR